MTNGQAIAQGLVPCETNPTTGALSRTGETFHGSAELTLGQRLNPLARRVCRSCGETHHRHLKRLARGVRFPHDAVRKVLRAAAAILVALLAVAPAEAGIFDRLRDAGASLIGERVDLGVGTVLAVAAIDDGSTRTAALVLDTTIQQRVVCYAFSDADRGRVEADVAPGATLEALTVLPGSVTMGELNCQMLDRWRAQRKGNPTRRDFIVSYRAPILAYALRGRPGTIAAFDLEGLLMPAAAELRRVADTLEAAGLTVGIGAAAAPAVIEVSDLPDPGPDPSLLSCRATLRDVRGALVDVEEAAISLPQQPGLGPISSSASSGVDAIDAYFRSHPGV